MYEHRLAASIAAMTVSLGGIDALVFTGGVGENQPAVRAEACRRLRLLGLSVVPAVNDSTRSDSVISEPRATPSTLVVTAREELEIAAATRAVIDGRG